MSTTDPALDYSPRPDPSFLTTAQLLREVQALRELLETRLNAIDKATEIFQANLVRVPTDVQRAVATLQSLHDARFDAVYTTINAQSSLTGEKLDGIREQFALRDKAVKETSDLNATALQAALAAAEKSAQKTNDSFVVSAAKTEASFTKTQDSQAAAVSAISSAMNDKMNDIKDRINSAEGRINSSEGRSGGVNAMWGWVVAGVGLLVSILMAALAVFAFLHSQGVVVVPKP